MHYQRPLIGSLLLIISLTVLSAYSINLRGTVLDRKGNPVSGAVVSLQMQRITDTTDYQGRFSFTSTNASSEKPAMPAPAVQPVRFVDGAVQFENPADQTVALTLFDLRGKVVGKLQNGYLSAGNHRFALPPFSRNQALVLHTQIGPVTTICRFIGSASTVFPLNNNPDKRLPSRSAEVTLEKVKVSHLNFSETTLSISSLDDSLSVRLFPKVDYRKTMVMSVGDTFFTFADQIELSLDSINDSRCGCDMFCAWEGNAALYFTVRIQDKRTGIVLGTYDKREVAIGGYTLRLVEISPPCPSGQEENYQVYIAFYPAENPAKLLFVEHFTTRDGHTINETGICPMLHIDFPTYFFSSPKQELRYGGIGTAPGADTTLLIYGSGVSLSGDAGGGAASGLTAVNTLPHSDGTSGTVSLTTISANGTISVTCNGKSLTIPPGTTWTDTTRSIDSTSKNCRMDITQVERISNFGFLLPYQVIPKL